MWMRMNVPLTSRTRPFLILFLSFSESWGCESPSGMYLPSLDCV
jgi:hypothetical protein